MHLLQVSPSLSRRVFRLFPGRVSCASRSFQTDKEIIRRPGYWERPVRSPKRLKRLLAGIATRLGRSFPRKGEGARSAPAVGGREVVFLVAPPHKLPNRCAVDRNMRNAACVSRQKLPRRTDQTRTEHKLPLVLSFLANPKPRKQAPGLSSSSDEPASPPLLLPFRRLIFLPVSFPVFHGRGCLFGHACCTVLRCVLIASLSGISQPSGVRY